MKLRWTRLRTLLLVTGVFSLILLASAEEVAQISGSGLLETALTTGFALSLISFLVIGSVGLGKKAVRDVRKVYNQRVAKCSFATNLYQRRVSAKWDDSTPSIIRLFILMPGTGIKSGAEFGFSPLFHAYYSSSSQCISFLAETISDFWSSRYP